MADYSKALRERRFPQDVATVAYVHLRVWTLDTLRAFRRRLNVQEFVELPRRLVFTVCGL